MSKRIWSIALAYVGVMIGAGVSSGQDLLQYFVSFGAWGLIGDCSGKLLPLRRSLSSPGRNQSPCYLPYFGYRFDYHLFPVWLCYDSGGRG